MKTIKLTPKQLSKLLNVELDKIVDAVIVQKNIRMPPPNEYEAILKSKKTLANREMDFNDVAIMQQYHLEGMNNFDLLKETVTQLNANWRQVMFDVCHNNTCIKDIAFSGNFKYYDAVLEDEHVETIIAKLAEYHLTIYGKKTKEYTRYTREKALKTEKPVAV